MQHVHLSCTVQDFIEHDTSAVRWLERDADYELMREFMAPVMELSYAEWVEWHDLGYTYAAIIENGQIVSCAAVWCYTEQAWEVAAVVTRDDFQRCGYGTLVVAFVTAHILQHGRLATCTTLEKNTAMLAIARRVGFKIVAPEGK